MSKRYRRVSDRRSDRRDSQPEDEHQRRTGENDVQEGDSLVALKAILSKVSALLRPLQLTSDESIRLVEQLYSKVLETDLQLAAETDDTRKSSVLGAIQNATIRRGEDGAIVVEYPQMPAEKPVSEEEVTKATVLDEPAPAAAQNESGSAEPKNAPPTETAPAKEAPATPEAPEAASGDGDSTEEAPAKKTPRRTTSKRSTPSKRVSTRTEAPADTETPADTEPPAQTELPGDD